MNVILLCCLQYGLERCAGKGCSVNQLRHSFLTNKYADSIKMKADMAADMALMGTSLSQSDVYIKKD